MNLNDMHTRKCGDCNHQWVQPAAAGNCPKCHSANTETVSHRVNDKLRI